MKAAFLSGPKQPFTIKEVPTPVPASNEVLIKLAFSSLNRRDLRIRDGLYAQVPLPAGGQILGSDGYGIVAGAGSGANRFRTGDPVIINPGLSWGDDPAAFGPAFRILGNPDPGTFAEYIAIGEQYVYPKPSHLSDEEAGAFPLAGLTTYRAVFTRGAVRTGEKVMITGIGAGTALLALQFAKTAGAEVFVTSGSQDKIDRAVALGARAGYNYKEEGWAEKAVKEAGAFDLVLDSASGKGFVDLITLLRPGGRLVFWGGTDGAINNLIPAQIYWKNLSILGTTMGTPADFESMLEYSVRHNIRPVVDKVYPSLADTEEAFSYMSKGQQFGKIVLTNKT